MQLKSDLKLKKIVDFLERLELCLLDAISHAEAQFDCMVMEKTKAFDLYWEWKMYAKIGN